MEEHYWPIFCASGLHEASEPIQSRCCEGMHVWYRPLLTPASSHHRNDRVHYDIHRSFLLPGRGESGELCVDNAEIVNTVEK